jgi:hypothetical protein
MLTLMLGLTVALSACSRSDPDEIVGAAPDPEAALPATLFVSSAPADAVALVDAKSTARPGDRVVFEARVGGRVEPFVPSRAVFFVADRSLLSCKELHEEADACKTPWDYCCEPSANLLEHMATVQVVDDAGRPLKASLERHRGLDPLSYVVIVGTVAQNEAGNFVVNAEAIHVQEG